MRHSNSANEDGPSIFFTMVLRSLHPKIKKSNSTCSNRQRQTNLQLPQKCLQNPQIIKNQTFLRISCPSFCVSSNSSSSLTSQNFASVHSLHSMHSSTHARMTQTISILQLSATSVSASRSHSSLSVFSATSLSAKEKARFKVRIFQMSQYRPTPLRCTSINTSNQRKHMSHCECSAFTPFHHLSVPYSAARLLCYQKYGRI